MYKNINELHDKFSKETDKDTLLELKEAIDEGANINTSYYGFLQRNVPISKSEYLIAFSFADTPSSFGTLNTWNQAKTNNKICCDISKL